VVIVDSSQGDPPTQTPTSDEVHVVSWRTIARTVSAATLACAAALWGVTALYLQDPCSLVENTGCDAWSDLQQMGVTAGSLLGFLGLLGLAGSFAPGRSRPALFRASTRAVAGALLLIALLLLDRRAF
jgi:hypothetical protein